MNVWRLLIVLSPPEIESRTLRDTMNMFCRLHMRLLFLQHYETSIPVFLSQTSPKCARMVGWGELKCEWNQLQARCRCNLTFLFGQVGQACVPQYFGWRGSKVENERKKASPFVSCGAGGTCWAQRGEIILQDIYIIDTWYSAVSPRVQIVEKDGEIYYY